MRLTLASAFITSPVLVAQHLNYFEEEGIDLLGTGEADISVVATAPVVFNSFLRDDYSIFVTYTTTYDGVKVIARNDRGISKPEDLVGKRIGVVGGTISDLLIDSLLTYHKIPQTDVSLVNLQADQMAGALIKGEIDAISVWNPMVRILRALSRAIKYMNENESETILILSEILDLDRDTVKRNWEVTNFSLSLDQLLLMTMEYESEWAIRNNFTEEGSAPDYLNYIYFKALNKVDPDSVTIIQDNE